MNADFIVNIQPVDPPIHVVCSNSQIMRSTYTAELSFTKLLSTTRNTMFSYPQYVYSHIRRKIVNKISNGETVVGEVRTNRLC